MSLSKNQPLELDAATMRSLVDRAMARIVSHIESLPEQPMDGSAGGRELARSLAEPLPEDGTDFDALLDLLFDHTIERSFNTASPGYLGYIPSGGIFQSALADLIAGSVNRYVGVWIAAPGLVQLEANVVRWLCEMVGYPASAGGILTTGGSIANLTAVVAARREKLGESFSDGIIYTSEEVHHSVLKAAMLAGFPSRNVRAIAVDADFRVRTDEIEHQIKADRKAGLRPFLIAASAGTTNTGAVDDLERLADLATEHGLWFHVDAAYGGFFMLTERGRTAMRGLERADSITLDPHKGLFLPYGNGSLIVRDPGALQRAHSVTADYMPQIQADGELIDFCEISPELSREFRGLRVWLPIKMHGIGVFRQSLEEKIDLSHWATDELAKIPGIEILAKPQLSLVVFRLRLPGHEGDDLDHLNHQLLDRINAKQRVYLTGTKLSGPHRGAYALRICVLSFRTHRDRMEMALDDIRQSVAELSAREAEQREHALSCGSAAG